MTKKDYELVAVAINKALNGCQGEYYKNGVRRAACSICNSLMIENPRFDADKFLAACGIAK